nr:uncharacterized protein LOC117227600 isoform X1 [Megalopta genalis]XP_033338887.1 uncharacterized protein LOC117227600 isoform X2 [Megalopta genalis]
MGSKRVELYDISAKDREVLEWQAARRKQLRESYLKQVHNPVNQKLVMDPGIHRYSYVRQYYHLLDRINLRNFTIGTLLLMFTMWATRNTIVQEQDETRKKLWTGQTKYADVVYKFRI